MERNPGKGGPTALRIVLIYIIVGSLWILLSDRALAHLIKDPDLRVHVSIIKGWVYVLATGWMLYALIRSRTHALSRANDALCESQERYRQLFELSPDAVLVHREGKILLMNNAGCALARAGDCKELIGKSVIDLVHPDDRKRIQRRLARLAKGDSLPPAEVRVIRMDGTLAYGELASTLFIYDGSPAVLTIARDITERKLLEDNKREFYQRTILAATEGKLVITDKEKISDLVGPAAAYWHITAEEELSAIRSDVRQRAESLGMEDSRVFDLVLCVGEATTNAVKHAGRGIASLHESTDALIFMVADSGAGIEALNLPELALKKGYTTATSLGMGYKAMISVADKVYLATGNDGTTVAVEMKVQAVKTPPILSALPDSWGDDV